ncbi:hypothetical protein CR513_19878, partial [Mucuna pruriens]
MQREERVHSVLNLNGVAYALITSRPNSKTTNKLLIRHRTTRTKTLLPHASNTTFKKRRNCYACGKLGHHAPQYRYYVTRNNNPPKPRANLVKEDDIIVVVVSQDTFPLSASTSSRQPFNFSNEPMNEELRRSKRQRKETSFGNGFYTYLVEDDPMDFLEVTSALDVKLWEQAIRTKTYSIKKSNTWKIVDKPRGAKPIGCKWIFKTKLNLDGFIDKYKARLIAKGFTQKPNIDYFDSFSPIAKISLIRILIALASIHKLAILQMVVKTAFLNDELEEEIYMTQPEECVVSSQENKTTINTCGILDFENK